MTPTLLRRRFTLSIYAKGVSAISTKVDDQYEVKVNMSLDITEHGVASAGLLKQVIVQNE